ncbi:phosphatidate cytidylyltransferase [Microvirga flavescens]|uniref:phosphatidate cytidylyltransferase n=1 Tax=Microvirga flavescens TaxID=2249811 RepID=UPI000DD5521B|nr:phosphatidate cytidylyltransferase [Microvirga flavescens]
MAGGEEGAAKPTAGFASSELGKRVASAIVLIPIALAAAWQGGWAFALFWLAAGIATAWEWTNMTRVAPRLPVQAVLGVGLTVLTVLLLTDASFVAFAGVCALTLLAAALLSEGREGKFWALTGFAYAVVLTLVPPIVREHPNLGLPGLLWMFAVVWSTDIAAYFTGRSLGGPKLWPRVSPKKTWSGFAGGLLAAAVAGFLVAWGVQKLGLMPPFSLRNVVMLSLVASVASQLGDLGESALKRHCDVKDSSHLIPGHGGVMDRLDGFWAVALILGIVLLIIRFAS